MEVPRSFHLLPGLRDSCMAVSSFCESAAKFFPPALSFSWCRCGIDSAPLRVRCPAQARHVNPCLRGATHCPGLRVVSDLSFPPPDPFPRNAGVRRLGSCRYIWIEALGSISRNPRGMET